MERKNSGRTGKIGFFECITLILFCITILTVGILLIGPATAPREMMVEYPTEEEIGDLIFIK